MHTTYILRCVLKEVQSSVNESLASFNPAEDRLQYRRLEG